MLQVLPQISAVPGVEVEAVRSDTVRIATANVPLYGMDGNAVDPALGAQFTIVDQIHTCIAPSTGMDEAMQSDAGKSGVTDTGTAENPISGGSSEESEVEGDTADPGEEDAAAAPTAEQWPAQEEGNGVTKVWTVKNEDELYDALMQAAADGAAVPDGSHYAKIVLSGASACDSGMLLPCGAESRRTCFVWTLV
jgi:hypothetical protein